MIKKLGRFNPREILHAINSIIDELLRIAPRSAPGTLRKQSYKGARRSGSGGGNAQQTTQQTIPVARWQ
jgi:hypothetical protein